MAQSASSFLDAPGGKGAAASFLGPSPSDHLDHHSDAAKEWAKRYADAGFSNAAWQGVTMGFGDEIDAKVIGTLYGKEYGQAIEDQERRNAAEYAKTHPKMSAAANVVGGLLTPGVGRAAKVVGAIERPAARVLGSALLGGGIGATAGAGEAENGHRGTGAVTGGMFGAALGGGLHVLGNVAKTAGGAIDEATGHAISNGARRLVDHAKTLVGASVDPYVPTVVRKAAERLRNAIADDRVTPAHIEAVRKERAAHGLPDPTLAQVGDQNVEGVLRAASSKMGEGRSASVAERRSQRGNLAARGREHAEIVKPARTETAQQAAERLRSTRELDAATKYREPYAKLVPVDDHLMELISSPEADKAMAAAERTAGERVSEDGAIAAESKSQARQIASLRNYRRDVAKYEAEHAEWERNAGLDMSHLDEPSKEMLAQLDKTPPPPREGDTPEVVEQRAKAIRDRLLKNLGVKEVPEPQPPALPEISAGALDRVRIALRNRADSLKDVPGGEKKATHALGVALSGREKALDAYLDKVPGLEEARGSYKATTQAIEAAEFRGKVLDQQPQDFARYVATLPQQGREALRTVTHQQIVQALGTPREAQSLLEKLATDADAHDNLVTLLGPADADRLSRAAHLRLEDLRKATRIAPDTGSQTFSRAEDAHFLAKAWQHLTSPTGLLKTSLESLLRGGQWHMSREEATALEALGRGNPDVVMRLLRDQPHSTLAQLINTAIAREGAQYEGQQQAEGQRETDQKIEELQP